MINILSYVGMNMQSEVCLWCLLGLVRTIFDATLFKVNANLKQVWQMTMPEELTMPVQRVLRTMVSGVMLVQCFTVYVYLASYIVLLYPVFLEERPTLVLPWLLLAAIRKLLCELTSLALGLGTCVLLGPARPPCIKFVVVKFSSIMPAFYMWMLVFSYYHALKVATAFKTFPAVLPPNDNDYGLELAVRRRRTKSLLGEEQLRRKLVAHFYGERTSSITNETFLRPPLEMSSRMVHSADTSIGEEVPESDTMKPLTMSTTGWSDIGAYEDWFGSEVMIPRDTDRILEQIVLMLLRIGAYLKKEGIESILDSQKLNSAVPASWHQCDNIDCAAMNADDTDTPPLVGSNKGNMASYLREYPQIFMKKLSTDNPQTERTIASLKNVHSHGETDEGITSKHKVKRISSSTSSETTSIEFEKVPSKKKITISDNTTGENKIMQQKWPTHLQTSQIANTEGKKNKPKLRKSRDSEGSSQTNDSPMTNEYQNNLNETDISTKETKKQSSHSKTSSSDSNKDCPQCLLHADNSIKNMTLDYTTSKENNNEGNTDTEILNINVTSDASHKDASEKLPNNPTLNINKRTTNEMLVLTQTNDYPMSNDHQNNMDESDISTDETKKESLDSKTSSSVSNKNCPQCLLHVDNNIKNISLAYITRKENNNEENNDSEISNINVASDAITLNEDAKEKTTNGPILDNNTKEMLPTLSKLKSEASSNGGIYDEVTGSRMVKDNNSEGLKNNLIRNDNRSKEPPGVKILDDDKLIDNGKINLGKNKQQLYELENVNEFTQNETDDQNEQLSLRKLLTHGNTIDSLDVKLSDKNIEKESRHSVNLNKDNNKEFPQQEISINDNNTELPDGRVSNEGRNKVSTDIQISDEAKTDENSTDGVKSNEDKSEESTEAISECNLNEKYVADNSTKSK